MSESSTTSRSIVLGEGKWLIGHSLMDGSPALVLGPAPDQQRIGTRPSVQASEYADEHGSLVIEFKNIQAIDLSIEEVRAVRSLIQTSARAYGPYGDEHPEIPQ